MSIRYSLHPNKLKGNKGTYYAQVDYRNVVDIEQIIEHILSRGSSVSKFDILAVYHELQESVCYFLREGYRINTSLLQVYPSIRGKFSSYEESFNRNTHSIVPCVEPGKVLNKSIENTKVEKVYPNLQNPVISIFRDATSGQSDSVLSPGGIGIIDGKHLKFNEADPLQGLFFINSEGVKLKVDRFVKATNVQIIFQIPLDLVTGQYFLEVIRIVKDSKSTRRTKYHMALSVKE